MIKRKLLFAIVVFCLIFSSIVGCSNSEKKFQDVYRELLIAHKDYNDTSELRKAIDSIFKKYNYTKEEFLEDLENLKRKPEEVLKIIDTINIKIQKN